MTKKVLQLIETSGPGGAERVLVNLVGQLSQRGYYPLICLRKSGWLSQQLEALPSQIKIIPQDGYINCRWFRHIGNLIRAEQVSVIHAHEFSMNVYGTILSAITGVPLVTTVHGKSYYSEKWRRRFAYRLVSRGSKMVAVSEDIRQFLINKVGIKEKHVITIPNGIDVSAYDDRFDAEQRPTNGPRKYVIGSVGSLYPVKGHTYLLKALAIVLKKHPDVICKIAGQGHLISQLEVEAAELGIEQRIEFLGLCDNIPQFLQNIDIFVLPSVSEGLPLAILEAMAAGKPIIATNVGGISEAVQDQRSGFLVPPRDPAALAQRITQVLADPVLSRELGAAGRERVKRHFSLEKMAKHYQALYG